MKILFFTLLLTLASGTYAQPVFSVSVEATIEDDIESILDQRAQRECDGNGLVAQRVSLIKTDYKPYRYFITAWAKYICVY